MITQKLSERTIRKRWNESKFFEPEPSFEYRAQTSSSFILIKL